MKTIRTFIFPLIAAAFMAGNFTACTQESPLAAGSSAATLSKRRLIATADNLTGTTEDNLTGTTEKGSMSARYYKKWDAYQGGKIILSQGSQFELLYGSLTPPPELYGQNVTLTMTVVQDPVTGELLFEFGPSGCQFEPAATVWFHYTSSTVPNLYYIDENGNYVEQPADEVDTKNQWIMLKIHHFSRYALAWSR